MKVRLELIVVAMLALPAGCSGEEPGRPTGRASEEPARVVDHGDCPNALDLIADEGAHGEGRLAGDVSGDGRDDEVFLAVEEGAETGCRAILFAETAEGVLAAGVDESGTAIELGLPLLNSLAEIDGEPGLEVVVDVLSGASTGFVAVFSLDEGSLGTVGVRGGGAPGGLWGYGGGVAHAEAVDCDDGAVARYTATMVDEQVYETKRDLYIPTEGALVRDPDRTATTRVDARDLLQRFPAFSSAPFASCAAS